MATKTNAAPKTPPLNLGGLDLGALDAPAPDAAPTGKAPRAPLEMFYEDPDQPRKEYPEEQMNEMAESIAERGVLQPIIVRPPETAGPMAGRMKIVFGHRRFRGSVRAKASDIPYLIEEDATKFDDFAQVVENENRLNLSPKELALFVKKKISEGFSQAEISRKINKQKSTITHLLGFIEGPAFILELYDSEKCRSPQYLYDLANLAKKHPEEVQRFCETSEEFNRTTIAALSASLKAGGVVTNNDSSSSGNLGLSASGSGESATGGGLGDAGQQSQGGEGGRSDEGTPPVVRLPSHNPANENKPGAKPPKTPDPTRIKKPLLIGTHEKRDVMVLLYRMPTTPGLVHVSYSDDQTEAEVEFGKLKNLTLTESRA